MESKQLFKGANFAQESKDVGATISLRDSININKQALLYVNRFEFQCIFAKSLYSNVI